MLPVGRAGWSGADALNFNPNTLNPRNVSEMCGLRDLFGLLGYGRLGFLGAPGVWRPGGRSQELMWFLRFYFSPSFLMLLGALVAIPFKSEQRACCHTARCLPDATSKMRVHTSGAAQVFTILALRL